MTYVDAWLLREHQQIMTIRETEHLTVISCARSRRSAQQAGDRQALFGVILGFLAHRAPRLALRRLHADQFGQRLPTEFLLSMLWNNRFRAEKLISRISSLS